jgi:hypothetical protein
MKQITTYSSLEREKYYLNYYTMVSGSKTLYIIHTFGEEMRDTIVCTLSSAKDPSWKVNADMEVDTMENVVMNCEDFLTDLFFELDESEYNLILLSESI